MKIVPIIKTVGVACNLKCTYCWFNPLDQSTVHLMSNDVLHNLVQGYAEADESGRYQFIWHGGEPLMAGRGYFEEAIRLQRHYMADAKIKNVIQTNATLLDDKWTDFFMENEFKVGVSLDGPKEMHDHFRITPTGKGSHDRVMNNLAGLRKKGMKFAVIATINSRNVDAPDEIFNFFIDNDITSFGFNMVYEKDPTGKPFSFSVTNEQYATFQNRIFDLWLNRNDSRIRIRHIDAILTGMMGKLSRSCIYAGTCDNFINVGSNGDVYPCERLTDAPRLGNIMDAPLKEILASDRYGDHSAMTRALPLDCQQCKYLNACQNGCTHHRDNGKLFFCHGRLDVFRHVEQRLSDLSQSLAPALLRN